MIARIDRLSSILIGGPDIFFRSFLNHINSVGCGPRVSIRTNSTSLIEQLGAMICSPRLDPVIFT